MSSLDSTIMASQPRVVARNSREQRTVEAFLEAPSLQPLVAGHMCKQDKTRHTFSKRYFALYDGGLLVYYTHQRDFESDVKKHHGIPLQCTLVKLKGLYLTRPKAFYHGIKHSFTLHAPETSNHRGEFLLACRTKKDMKIWVEQLQSQNSTLAQCERARKPPSYIQKMRLHRSESLKQQRASFDDLDCGWLRSSSYCPGDIAMKFHSDSESTLATEPELHIELEC